MGVSAFTTSLLEAFVATCMGQFMLIIISNVKDAFQSRRDEITTQNTDEYLLFYRRSKLFNVSSVIRQYRGETSDLVSRAVNCWGKIDSLNRLLLFKCIRS